MDKRLSSTEKFSGWMVREGYKMSVNCMAELTPETQKFQENVGWEKCTSFDERIAVDVNHVDQALSEKDWFDGTCEQLCQL